MADRLRLHASPSSALADSPLDVRVTGSRSGARVTVRARVDDRERGRWRSEAVYEADGDGVVNVATARPVSGGCATAAEDRPVAVKQAGALGLLWSLERDPGSAPALGFAGPSVPFDVELSATADGASSEGCRIQRCFIGPGLAREPVHEAGLVGAFFSSADETPRPGVLVVGGSDGGLNEGQAALLASHGFAALALAYFRAEGLPPELVEIPLEYFETAIRWLRNRRGVAAGGLGVVGRSRGGELALLLAATLSEITAVVGYVPSGVVHAGILAPAGSSEARSAWTHRGRPLPFVSPPAVAVPTASDVDAPIELTPMFLKSLEDRAAVEAAAIPVERINGSVLLISGEDDRLWPSPILAEIAVARFAAHRHPHPVTHLRYAGAGHSIGPNGLPTTANTIVHPVRRRAMALGGTPAANAAAAADSWPRVLQFLRTALAGS